MCFCVTQCTPISGLAAAREQARKLMIEDYRVREQENTAARLEERAEAQEAEFDKLQRDICALYGTAETKWEKLWDDSYYQHFFYNWQSQVSLWERPAICEKCDSTIDPMDVRCFLCGKERSQANLAYYQGLTDLSAPPPPDDNDGIADDDDG